MGKRILLVDDDRVVLAVLCDALERLGSEYDIVALRDAEQARDLVDREHFDLLITDLSLPGMTGIELTDALRVGGHRMRVVWITAHDCQKVCEEGEELGVYRCLDKPVGIETIRQVVREALNGHSPSLEPEPIA